MLISRKRKRELKEIRQKADKLRSEFSGKILQAMYYSQLEFKEVKRILNNIVSELDSAAIRKDLKEIIDNTFFKIHPIAKGKEQNQ